MHRVLLMKQENLNELIVKRLDMDFEKYFYSKLWIVLVVVLLIFCVIDLILFFQGEKLGFSVSLLCLGVIVIIYLPILYLSKISEAKKNSLVGLMIKSDGFVLEYKNGYQKQINVSDIKKVFVDIKFGKFSRAYASIYTSDEKILFDTGMIKNFYSFLKYLKVKGVNLEYSNKIVEFDVNGATTNPQKHNLKCFFMGILVVVLYFFCLWLISKN